MTMLTVFTGPIETLQDFPTLRNPQLTQAADANAKYCLWDRGRIVDATDPSVALEWLLF